MRAYRVEKKVLQHGKIQLEALPFADGEVVEVIVLAREHSDPEELATEASLKGSVLEYIDPVEPVAESEWHPITGPHA